MQFYSKFKISKFHSNLAQSFEISLLPKYEANYMGNSF